MRASTTTYFELQDALSEPGCPICRIGEEAGRRMLDGLLYESVNDPTAREKLKDSLGFCHVHSRQLLTFSGERLGAAIIERAVLQEAIRRLSQVAKPSSSSRLRNWLSDNGGEESALPPGGPCPICDHQAAVEKRAVEELMRHLMDEFKEPLRVAGGLCWPHLQLALRVKRKARAKSVLLEIQESAWKELSGHLDEFIRKRDYRFRHEGLSEQEAASIERAIAALTGGREGVET
ncbi:MAG: hypothetical protein GXP42_16725 [Chloroflexi bacterium]|nr:hypothetical protein [Chloroflexota bacterium]